MTYRVIYAPVLWATSKGRLLPRGRFIVTVLDGDTVVGYVGNDGLTKEDPFEFDTVEAATEAGRVLTESS